MRNPKHRFEIRTKRVRSAIASLSDRPRLSIFKSGKHIYAQVIDDSKAVTVASASTLDKDLKGAKLGCNKIAAEKVGTLVGQRASAKGVTKVVFDKGGYKYHGVVQALADAARKELEF